MYVSGSCYLSVYHTVSTREETALKPMTANLINSSIFHYLLRWVLQLSHKLALGSHLVSELDQTQTFYPTKWIKKKLTTLVSSFSFLKLHCLTLVRQYRHTQITACCTASTIDASIKCKSVLHVHNSCCQETFLNYFKIIFDDRQIIASESATWHAQDVFFDLINF